MIFLMYLQFLTLILSLNIILWYILIDMISMTFSLLYDVI